MDPINKRSENRELLKELEKLNQEKSEITLSPEYIKGITWLKMSQYIKSFDLRSIARFIIRHKRLSKMNFPRPQGIITPLNPYMGNPPKIAVYSCIMGGYDEIREPLYLPKNCDFYMITDEKPENESRFKILDPYKYYKGNDGSYTLIQRYIKMHPHEIFDDYEYSIYIDGNIRVISDPTPLIQRISALGIALHRHYERCCLYDEGETCIIYKKGSSDDIYNQLNLYREWGMPAQFGLFECGIMARKHHEPSCIQLMSEWWNQCRKFSSRDQLSFPYVLWKNGYSFHDVGLLGSDLRKNFIFDFKIEHKKQL